MNRNLYLSLLFFFLLFLQVLILNNINLFGYVNPYLYIAFVFVYPIEKNRNNLLTFSFLLGLLVDFFMNSGGVNAMATLSIAYIRLPLFKRIFQISENEYPLFNLRTELFGNVFLFVLILTFIHHLILFSLLNFSFNHYFMNVIVNTAFSSLFTIVLYFLGSFIFTSKNRNET